MKIPRQEMPTQPPEVRIQNFEEVNLGFTEGQAQTEALRCLQCRKPLCVTGCPVGVNIPEFVRMVAEGRFEEAGERLRQDNALPAVCGRVCPQEEQCERLCVLSRKTDPLSIGRLERFAADRTQAASDGATVPPTGRRVAIIGSGPAGLTVAGDLVRLGHSVTVFEALHEVGGVLVYGIPEFRLPKSILRVEVQALRDLGVAFEVNAVVGRTVSIDDLFEEGYDAVFIGTGAGLPHFLDIPGEDLNGVYSANEFLTRINLMRAYRFPEFDSPVKVGRRTAVIGGGNTAMDAVRTARRVGAERAMLLYRRSRAEMPARAEEVQHAEEEGIEFVTLVAPTRFIGDEEGWLTGVEVVRMELEEPDASGRRRPVPVEGSEYVIEVETAVIAVGNEANSSALSGTTGIQMNPRGLIATDPETGSTSRPGVFAGGDIVTGGATVILAMGAGRKAARAIHEYLMR